MINLTDEELYEESMKDIDPRTLELMNLKFENLNLREQQEKDTKLILLLLNALGVAVNSTYQLDGTGIGVAVVDSGVYEGHRSFYDNVNLLGGDRVTKHMDFTVSSGSNSSTSRDPFGHGSHVAGLIAGGKGQSGELTQYRSMAPNAKIINVRVLGSNGTGTSAGLLQGLDWIYTNRAANNIKVVNMSLGTPAVETWRNDPLCRAVRKLVDAGIVVVAAAGNNGKNAAGQKQYGAIHSPGNDPSVITVGATNTFGTDARNDDGIARFDDLDAAAVYTTADTGGSPIPGGFVYIRIFSDGTVNGGDTYADSALVAAVNNATNSPTPDVPDTVDIAPSSGTFLNQTVSAIPEPSVLAFCGIGSLLMAYRRKMKKA